MHYTVDRKVALPIIQKQVGHRSLKTTSVYLRPSTEKMAEAYEKAGLEAGITWEKGPTFCKKGLHYPPDSAIVPPTKPENGGIYGCPANIWLRDYEDTDRKHVLSTWWSSEWLWISHESRLSAWIHIFSKSSNLQRIQELVYLSSWYRMLPIE